MRGTERRLRLSDCGGHARQSLGGDGSTGKGAVERGFLFEQANTKRDCLPFHCLEQRARARLLLLCQLERLRMLQDVNRSGYPFSSAAKARPIPRPA